MNDKEPNGFSPLHIAALYNQVALVRHLLGLGADAASTNNWNDTPLHRAASLGYAEMCQVLLEAGADPDFEDWRNKTPSDYAKEEVRACASDGPRHPLLGPLLCTCSSFTDVAPPPSLPAECARSSNAQR